MDDTTREQLIVAYENWTSASAVKKALDEDLAYFVKEAKKKLGPKKWDILGMPGYLARLPQRAKEAQELRASLTEAAKAQEEARNRYLLTGARCIDKPRSGTLKIEFSRRPYGAYRSTMSDRKYTNTQAEYDAFVIDAFGIETEVEILDQEVVVWVKVGHVVDTHLISATFPPKEAFIDFCLRRTINPMVYDPSITYSQYKEGLYRKERAEQRLAFVRTFTPDQSVLKMDERVSAPASAYKPETHPDYYKPGDLVKVRGRNWRVLESEFPEAVKLEPLESHDDEPAYYSYVVPCVESILPMFEQGKPQLER